MNSNQEERQETEMMIVDKAEEILKNISLYDLIKLSMTNQQKGGEKDGKGGLRNLLQSSSNEINTAIKHQQQT
jgi:hypothetical protein